MLRWLAQLGSARVFASGIWKGLTTPYVLRNGVSTGYGMGLMIQDYRGAKIIQHGGTVRGGNSQMLKAVDLDLDIVIIANRDGRQMAAVDGSEMLLEPPGEMTPSALAGRFASDSLDVELTIGNSTQVWR